MNRELFVEQLRSYQAETASDRQCQAAFLQFVITHSDCFERSCSPGHVVGSAWLVDSTGTKVLLTHHRKLNRWIQLGGHADGEADIANVALREAEEESGLQDIALAVPGIFDLDIHRIPARPTEPEHLHYDCRYVFRCLGDESFTVSSESRNLAWVEISRIASLTEEISVLRMAEKWERLRPSLALPSAPQTPSSSFQREGKPA